jgi:flagellar basal-body rod modification protein FlgD
MSTLPITSPQVAASSSSSSSSSGRFSELSSEQFIKIIFTELSNQDPFKPNDSSALLEQLNSIRSIESDTQLTKQLSSIVTQNQLATAGNLIGRQVQGLTTDSNRVAGTVVSVARQDNDVSLLLDNGWVVPMDNVETILDPSIFGDGG